MVPLGEAKVVREGSDLTILTYGAMVHTCQEATTLCEEAGIDVELIDLRTLVPLDVAAIETSVWKTGRCVVVVEAPRTCSYASELATVVQERCFLSLEAPIRRITGFDTPFPHTLEHEYLPTAARIAAAVTESLEF